MAEVHAEEHEGVTEAEAGEATGEQRGSQRDDMSGCAPDPRTDRPSRKPIRNLEERRAYKQQRQAYRAWKKKKRKEVKVKDLGEKEEGVSQAVGKPSGLESLPHITPRREVQEPRKALTHLPVWTASKITYAQYMDYKEALNDTLSLSRMYAPHTTWKDCRFPFKTYLDIGCGALPQDLFYVHLNYNCLAIGIDTNPAAVAVANDALYRLEELRSSLTDFHDVFQKKYEDLLRAGVPERKHPHPDIRIHNTEVYDFPDEYFDVVELSLAVDREGYLPEDLMRQAFRVCKTGGVVLLRDCMRELWCQKEPVVKALPDLLLDLSRETNLGVPHRHPDLTHWILDYAEQVEKLIPTVPTDLTDEQRRGYLRALRELRRNFAVGRGNEKDIRRMREV